MESEYSNLIIPNLNEQQLAVLSRRLDKLLKCPITLDMFQSPIISNCGHTFNGSNFSLDEKKICPIDQQPIANDPLVQNLFVKNLIDQRVMVIFLELKGDFEFEHNCPFSGQPLFEAVKLPCGHILNKSGLTTWHKESPCCPFDEKEFEISEMIDDENSSQLAKDQYSKYLEKVKLFNSNLSSEVIKSKLDDRQVFVRNLLETMKCPISENIIKYPSIAACGHTFDIDSIDGKSTCPHDNSKLSDIIPNLTALDALKYLSSEFVQETNAYLAVSTDKKGVLLFLNPSTTLDRIGKIAISLGVVTPLEESKPEWHFPIFKVNGTYLSDGKEQISKIKQLNHPNDDIPILKLI